MRVYRDVEGVRVMSDVPPEHASLPCEPLRCWFMDSGPYITGIGFLPSVRPFTSRPESQALFDGSGSSVSDSGCRV